MLGDATGDPAIGARDMARFKEVETAWRRRLEAGPPGHAGLRPDEVGDPGAHTVSGEGGVSESTTTTEWRAAAVLVLLFPTAHGPATILTLRSADLRHHPGQVSFPGGSLEPGETAEAAAVREAREEIGLEANLHVVGRLSPVYVPPSRYRLQPVVASTGGRPALQVHSGEVASLVELTLAELIRPPSIEFETRLVAGSERSMPYFQAGQYRVWGATGLILSEIAVLWREVSAGLPRE